jgi:hypothetical protein
VARTGQKRNAYGVGWEIPKGRDHLEDLGLDRGIVLKLNLISMEGRRLVHLTQNRHK